MTKGLTILAVPKAFRGHIGVIQRNAIMSWTKLVPRPEIFLFGGEEGAAEFAAEIGATHIADVARNGYGTPLLADVFAQAEKRSERELMAYVNADIILPGTFTDGVARAAQRFGKFLAVGRRTNLDVREPIDFHEGWEEQLLARLKKEGWLESHTGIDFFVFPRGTYVDVPPLAIGRVWFDQWCIKYALQKGFPVADLTNYIPICHQLHDYNHVAGGRQWVYGGKEADENLIYYGERPHRYTILSANYALNANGKLRRVFWRRERLVIKNFFWKILVEKTFGIRKRLGLTSGARA